MTESNAKTKMPMRGVVYALLASLLFGVTTPLAKLLLAQIDAVLLAGLFYLGSGVGLFLLRLGAKFTPHAQSAQPVLQRKDWFWLTGAIICGGIAAPILLMLGLSSTQASAASLFLNLEGVFTAVIAWFVFKENFDRRVFIGMILIVLGGVALSFNSTGLALSAGLILIALACAGWAIDNNLTRKVSNFDAAQIASAKGLCAGLVNVSIAMVLGASIPFPPALACAEAMVIGFLGYGVSLVLYVLALRHIGAARTGAYFALAPFVGSTISVLVLKEQPTPHLLAAAALMAIGLYLHLTEVHEHEHEHQEIEHEHEHVHDEHHQHEHGPDDPPGEPHVHLHKHRKMRHSHPHFPDQHHQHEH